MVILILIRVDFYYKAYKSKPRKKEGKKERNKKKIYKSWFESFS